MTARSTDTRPDSASVMTRSGRGECARRPVTSARTWSALRTLDAARKTPLTPTSVTARAVSSSAVMTPGSPTIRTAPARVASGAGKQLAATVFVSAAGRAATDAAAATLGRSVASSATGSATNPARVAATMTSRRERCTRSRYVSRSLRGAQSGRPVRVDRSAAPPGVDAGFLLPRQALDLGHQLVGPGPQGSRCRDAPSRPRHRLTEPDRDAAQPRHPGARWGDVEDADRRARDDRYPGLRREPRDTCPAAVQPAV